MKVRTDFVSNSSSSSFILGANGLFKHFNISKKDLEETLGVLYYGSKEKYEDALEKAEDGIMPFEVFDADEKSRALKEYGEELDCWTQSENPNQWIYDNIKDTLNHVYGYELPEEAEKVLGDIKNWYGILTAKNVFVKYGMFLVHFRENEIWSLAGVSEPFVKPISDDAEENPPPEEKTAETGEWLTKPFTTERIIEIIFSKMVELGKIKVDKDLLHEIYGNDCGDVYNWMSFWEESVLHFCGHEG